MGCSWLVPACKSQLLNIQEFYEPVMLINQEWPEIGHGQTTCKPAAFQTSFVCFIFTGFCWCLFCLDKVFLYVALGCSGTHSVVRAGFELRDQPTSASQELGLQHAWPL